MRHERGFTIVELIIVIVVIAILAAITIVAFNGVQGRARNSSTVSAVESYYKLIRLYQADTGQYPIPPASVTDPDDMVACLGSSYVSTACLGENDSFGLVYSQTWLNDELKREATALPPAPSTFSWVENGSETLHGGAVYLYLNQAPFYRHHQYLTDVGIDSADAMIVYYIEDGNINYCNISSTTHGRVWTVATSSWINKDVTICVIPLNN